MLTSRETSKRAAGSLGRLSALMLMAAATVAGCATARPVPTGDQPVAQAQVAGVVVSVPRLDSGDYPGDILDVANAVLVVIENRSAQEILIDPEAFTLGVAGGAQVPALQPQQLAYKERVKQPGILDQEGSMLAWRGGGGGGRGGGFHMSAPAPRMSGGGMGARAVGGGRFVPAPSFGGRGGSYGGRPYYSGGRGGYYGGYRGGYRGGFYGGGFYGGGYSRFGWWAGGPLYWGPSWGATWYGSPYFGDYLYDGPRYYAYSRQDAVNLGLPAARLPAGGRTGGFLYFPRVEQTGEGTPLVLQWSIREAAGQQVIGTVQLPLELRAD